MLLYYWFLSLSIMIFILNLIGVLISVSFLVLFERKLLSEIQMRLGPNKISLFGILQSFSDALKLFSKDFFLIIFSSSYMFLISPILVLMLSLMYWTIYSELLNFKDLKFSFIFMFCILSVSVYPLLLMGWFSSSKYSILGGVRAIAQSVSYEVSLVLIFLSLILLTKNFDLSFFLKFQCFSLFIMLSTVMYLLLFISLIAEMNRTPFDFSEGESELVSGFNTEYSSFSFSFIFLSEYTSIIFFSMLLSFMFFSISNLYLFFFISFHIMVIMWVRGSFPRFRYDYLMFMAWKMFLFISLVLMVFFMSLM